MNNYLYEIQISITPFLPATFSCAMHMIAEYVVLVQIIICISSYEKESSAYAGAELIHRCTHK